jgi:hypothetical protein
MLTSKGSARFDLIEKAFSRPKDEEQDQKMLNQLTDLTDEDIELITKCETIDDVGKEDFGLDLNISKVTMLFKEHRKSRGRKGMGELVEMLREPIEQKPELSKVEQLLHRS